jgi:filamentous hemagglutinin
MLTTTAAFIQAAAPLAANLVGDIGKEKQDAAQRDVLMYGERAKQAQANGDIEQANDYTAKATEAQRTADNWGDNGVYRIGLHVAAQGLIGGVTGGGAGAAGAVGGVVVGNQGQQLGKALGEAAADKLGLKDEARTTLVNTYQETFATLGGALGGLAASAAGGQGGASTLAGVAQGAGAAQTVDVNNRQLHPEEKKRIATDVALKYAAAHPGMTKAQAMTILEEQLLRQVDATAGAAGGWNQDAANYLNSYKAAHAGTTVGKDQWGNAVPLFGNASGNQRTDSTIFSANPQTTNAPTNLGGQQALDYVKGIGAGIADTVLHPIDTLVGGVKGLWGTVTDPTGTGQKMQDGARMEIDQAGLDTSPFGMAAGLSRAAVLTGPA